MFPSIPCTTMLIVWLLVSLSATASQVCQFDNIQQSSREKRFKVNSFTVVDRDTNLMWKRCFEGKNGKQCEIGSWSKMSWPAALQHAERVNSKGGFAGFNDWRIPNVRELGSIVELSCVNPTLNLTIFPSAPSQRVWSSSPYGLYPHYSWFVDFNTFRVDHLERFKKFGVILVRDI